MLLLVLAFIVLSIPSIQTSLAKRLAGYVNSELGTDISIQSLKLSRTGRVELHDVLARDTRRDTIIYVGSLQTDLLDFNKLLHGKTLLNTVQLRQAKVVMKTYKGDSIDELDRFIRLLDNSPPSNKPSGFLLTASLIEVEETSFALIDENQKKQPIVAYRNINGLVKNFKIKGSDIYAKVRNLSLVAENELNIEEMQTDFVYTNRYMYFHNTLINTAQSHIEADMEMHYTKKDLKSFTDKVNIEAHIDFASVALEDIKKFYPPLGNEDLYEFTGELKGTLNNFSINNLQLSSRSKGKYKGSIHLINAFDKK
jgi:hypothetical protein